MDIHLFITNFSYIGIFLLMVLNGTVNFPSSQFLYVICGYFVSTGSLMFIPTIIAGALGNTIGNIITFLLIKKYDKPLAKKILIMEDSMFEKVHGALYETFKERGMWWIFLGKLIPSIKAFIPVVAGLAGTKTIATSFLFLVASFIWAAAVTSLGYYFGESVSLSSVAAVSFVIALIVIFFVYKTFQKKFSK